MKTVRIFFALLLLFTMGVSAEAQDFGGQSGYVGSTGLGIGTTVSSSAYEASRVIKRSAGTLISIAGYNAKTTAQWIQIYNSATVPSDGAVPIVTFTVAGQTNFYFDVPATGFKFTTGISVSNSSTGPTKTIGSADVFYFAQIL